MKFSFEGKKKVSYGEVMAPLLDGTVAGKEDAWDWLIAYVDLMQEHDSANNVYKSREEYLKIAKSNANYYAGYSDIATMKRIEALIGGCHPIFGSVMNGAPSPDECVRLGMEMGKKLKEKGLL